MTDYRDGKPSHDAIDWKPLGPLWKESHAHSSNATLHFTFGYISCLSYLYIYHHKSISTPKITHHIVYILTNYIKLDILNVINLIFRLTLLVYRTGLLKSYYIMILFYNLNKI